MSVTPSCSASARRTESVGTVASATSASLSAPQLLQGPVAPATLLPGRGVDDLLLPDGVAGGASEGGAAVDEFAAAGVALFGGALGHGGDVVGLSGGGSGLGAEQGEEGVVLGDIRDVLDGEGGDFRWQGIGFECFGELFRDARGGEGFLPEIPGFLRIGKGGRDGCDEWQGGLAVVAGEGKGGEAAGGWLGVRGEFFQDVAGGG